MPTNLPPDYYQVEKRFRDAQSPAEKAALLEEMLSIVPKHKGTDHLRADLRRQLSKLRDESQSRKKHSVHQTIYHVEREGAGQVALVGAPNVGKSALVAALTRAAPEISDVPFITRRPVPGMMPFENIQIQLIDTPSQDPLFDDPGLFDLLRRVDLLLIVVDLQADPIEQMNNTLVMLEKHRLRPHHLFSDPPPQERTVFLPTILLANKCDDESLDEVFEIFCEFLDPVWQPLPVSALTGRNFQIIKEHIFNFLEIIRVYAKPPGKEADLEKPFVLKKGSTVVDMAEKVHRDFSEHLKSARVWGSSAFDGQLVQKEYVLSDGDIVELRI